MKSEISLVKTLQESDLTEVGICAGEIAIDSIIDDGLLRDIPIISTIVGLLKTTSDIGNMLFLKKIVYFLRGIKDVSPRKRYEMIAEIDNSPKYKIKVGEKLLYILNRCDDHEKAALIAQLFKAFLNKDIEYDDFIKGSYILNSIFINDFDTFLKLDKQNLHADEIMPFVSHGLCNILFCTPELVHHDQENRHDPPAYDAIEGAEPICEITDIGIKLIFIFNEMNQR